MEGKKLPPNLVRNAGMFYVCHRLSKMGWNAMFSRHATHLRDADVNWRRARKGGPRDARPRDHNYYPRHLQPCATRYAGAGYRTLRDTAILKLSALYPA